MNGRLCGRSDSLPAHQKIFRSWGRDGMTKDHRQMANLHKHWKDIFVKMKREEILMFFSDKDREMMA